MDALSKALITVENSDRGKDSFMPPKATHSQAGVSVEYTPDPKKAWLVIRASYGREQQVADSFISKGFYIYIARREEWVIVKERRQKVAKNLIPNILFVYISQKDADALMSKRSGDSVLSSVASYYYNHFRLKGGKNPPLEIPGSDMIKFIRITESADENIVYVTNESLVHFKSNDYACVREGKFVGCMGKVVRIAGQQRVGLQLAGLGWVATAYIPSAFLELVSKEEYEGHVRMLEMERN